MPPTRKSTAGQLREQITIESAGDSPFGEYSLERDYTTVYTLRARKIELTGNAKYNGIGQDNNISHLWVVRRGPVISTSDHVLKHGNDFYKLEYVKQIGTVPSDPREQWLHLYCEFISEEDAFKNPSPEQ